MRNQTRYLLLYLCVLGVLMGAATRMAQAQDASQTQQEASSEADEVVQLNQAELDQMLAPIALYPDTLLSHILVASTYPLEVVQAARWRAKNVNMDAKQALDSVEEKNWDPSVKALVPFNDLLQKFSQDLDWLQSLGDAFLLNEEQVLNSVQNLRQKAYGEGNLENNDYVEVSQDEGQIVIENVVKEVVYVPYYDTRVVYGNWWWGAYPPRYWQRPSHYVWSSGFYWSPSFYIYPSFYFGGFHWASHHVVANYNYRNNVHNYPQGRRVVSVREYPRWSHNPVHRRGVRYDHQQNPNRFVNSGQQGSKKSNQINKQRILNVEKLNNTGTYSKQNKVINKKNADRQQASNEGIKKRLQDTQKVTSVRNESHTKSNRKNVNDKQRVIKATNNKQQKKAVIENKQERQINSNQSAPNKSTVVKRNSTPVKQQSRSSNEESRKYSSNSNQHSKSRVQRYSQRKSSSNTQQSRQSKSSSREQKR